MFAADLIKKRRCWPKYLPGDTIVAHFAEKGIGESDALQGMLDDVKFHVVAMKEPDYVMMFMTTYGTLAPVGDEKRHYLVNGVKHVKTFRYMEVVHNHYQYRDVIDNHNSARMHPISMEETWMTMRWPNRVFCFLLAMTMFNMQNAATYFLQKPKLDSLQARCLIAKALINNVHLHTGMTPQKRPKCRFIKHVLTMVPPYKKFVQGRLTNWKMEYAKWK